MSTGVTAAGLASLAARSRSLTGAVSDSRLRIASTHLARRANVCKKPAEAFSSHGSRLVLDDDA